MTREGGFRNSWNPSLATPLGPQIVHWLCVSGVWNYPLRWEYLNVGAHHANWSHRVFWANARLPRKKAFKAFSYQKPIAIPVRRGRDERLFWPLRISRFYVRFFFFFDADLWIEFAHSNQSWFASYVGKQHWTNNEPQNRKKNSWPWNEPSLCFSVCLSQIVVWYTATGLYITLHSSSTRLEGIHPVHIQLIGDSGFTWSPQCP